MISEEIKNLKRTYKNSLKGEKIGRDFIAPCLGECIKYRRGTGTFSSSILKTYILSIDNIIDNQVKIEILCSPKIDLKLFEILQKLTDGEKRNNVIQKFLDDFVYDLTGVKDLKSRNFEEQLLSFLIAKEILVIRFAIPIRDADIEANIFEESEEQNYDNLVFRNMFHIKQGYFTFANDEIVAFDGSVNETDTALSHNQEKARVFKSWNEKHIEDVNEIVNDVDKDWGDSEENRNENIRIYPIGEEIIRLIKDKCPIERPKNKRGTKETIGIEKKPQKKFQFDTLWPHQEKAIKAWEDEGNQGILAMATGSGKTITAIAAIKKIREKVKGSLIHIVVPLRSLALQWIEGLEEFGLNTMLVSSDNPGWEDKLQNELMNMAVKGDEYKGPITVIVENSFKMPKFQKLIKSFSENEVIDKLLIVDECHHFNKVEALKALPKFFNLRMGLSATPFNRFDKENEKLFLLEYFKKEVFEYTLDDAIKDKFLTPYNYHVVPVTLDDEEINELNEITKNIAIAIDNYNDELRNILSGKRTRLLASAKDKLNQLENLIKENRRDYALAYCGAAQEEDLNEDDGSKIRIIEKVTKIFTDNNWQVGRITAGETMKDRVKIIKDLEDKVKNVIVSIKVLDEGIDIPCCQTAYILSSSKDDKQFIQRRGRVLRRHDASGKKLADIYDFAIISNDGSLSNAMKTLIDEEFYRINQFAKSALNKNEIFNTYKEELEGYE